MKLITLTQGEADDEVYLGRFWGCVNNDPDKPNYCDERFDCPDEIEPGTKLSASVTVQQRKEIERGQMELF